MKILILILALTNDWYTTINGQIYETPVVDCPGCVVEFVEIHQQDKWIQLRTDRIFMGRFD